ncbi:NAD-dependent epimerase/dehydratase family protein (plasmid) [Deinococcus psychrotolerans]|uniref:NAD-dependent epimerase/dehydratase family protein n=1 Tax=Deinococcus psychrotolerans TaxID=2489213 RepID=A0A3G8YIN4_9DEIO|nr:NAD(P)H-binding protein [Deinococcus psychrotolerans]AZI44620.1 NAD-dependent epimerase/dehydratase family protein [Deinococcus psychrotolerans]
MTNQRVLLTGGTGKLGQRVARELVKEGLRVRVLTRQLPSHPDPAYEWAQGDYVSGAGLADAFRNIDTVVHTAHDPQRPKRDLAGVARLHSYSLAAGARHFIQVGIVGAARVPGFGYYAAKVQAEAMLAESGLPFSIFRAAQFHPFVAGLLSSLERGPLVVVPVGTLQPVDIGEVAAALAQHALRGQPGVEEWVGPQVLTLEHLARQHLRASKKSKPVKALNLPLPVFKAIAGGALTDAQAARGRKTFETWLAETQPA